MLFKVLPFFNIQCFVSLGLKYMAPSYTSSDGEEEEQENLEDRKYPGEVTTNSFKIKFLPKDSKKDVLVYVPLSTRAKRCSLCKTSSRSETPTRGSVWDRALGHSAHKWVPELAVIFLPYGG